MSYKTCVFGFGIDPCRVVEDRDDSLLDMVLSKLYVFGSVSGLLCSRVSDNDIYMVESLY